MSLCYFVLSWKAFNILLGSSGMLPFGVLLTEGNAIRVKLSFFAWVHPVF